MLTKGVTVTRDQSGEVIPGVFGYGNSKSLNFAPAGSLRTTLPSGDDGGSGEILRLCSTDYCYIKLGGETIVATDQGMLVSPQYDTFIRRNPGQTHVAALGINNGVLSVAVVK